MTDICGASSSRKPATKGLADEVVFVGSRRDLENFYPALDIVALTSRNEGTPLTLIEAMANARPVISTAVGGVVDLLGQPLSEGIDDAFVVCERGVRVRPGDAQGFAAGLAHLAGDESLRREIGERGLQFVLAHYSKERLLADIKSLYAELCPTSSDLWSSKHWSRYPFSTRSVRTISPAFQGRGTVMECSRRVATPERT